MVAFTSNTLSVIILVVIFLFCRKICLATLLLSSLLILSSLNSVTPQARTTIFILPDGSINPADVPIKRDGGTYTFTADTFDPILIQKSNITIDGAGYSLIGPLNETQKQTEQVLGVGPNASITTPYIIGIDFDKSVSGVTIKNLNINWFSVGAYIRTTNNTLVDNSITDNIVGILLSGSANNITMNYIKDNRQGLFFGFEQINGSSSNIPSDIKVNKNSFLFNEMQLSGCVCKVYNFSEEIHAWDYDGKGNYWSDYNGTDSNNDGIGDIYYIIDLLNYDRYPLIESPAKQPTPTQPFPVAWIISAIVIIVVSIVAALTIRWKRRGNFYQNA
jgi:parallel beta-helix repeat protein